MNNTGYGQPVFKLIVFNGMTTHQQGPGLLNLGQPAFNNFPEYLVFHGLDRTGQDVHAQKWFSSHGIDIGQGIGSRDPAKGMGIVYNGGKKINGLDECSSLV